MSCLNFTISDFLGIFLIILPVYTFATIIILRGLNWVMEEFLGDLKKNIFHHHFHYKAKRD